MKLGIIARSEDRGLGIQTWEACRHLNPDRVLLIDPGGPHLQHPERYAGFDTTTLRWRGQLNEATVRTWLVGLDAVYTAETFYDQRIPGWAREVGCEPICHVNPEFFPDQWRRIPATWWAPTPWRLRRLPTGTRVVPMPVATDRFTAPTNSTARVLHVAGHPAVGDRNGTNIVREASGQTDISIVEASEANYWDLYAGFGILVMPRRYGGLCLPVQEAMAAGLAVVMTDTDPNRFWPGPRVPAWESGHARTPAGRIPLHSCDPDELARTIDDLTGSALSEAKAESVAWAAANSWDALAPVWMDAMQPCRI